MKKILLVSILLIPLMLIATPIGYAANPPMPPVAGERLVGPTTDGIIGIAYTPGTLGTLGNADILLWGTCNNQAIQYDFFTPNVGDFVSGLTEDGLLYQRFMAPVGGFCNSSNSEKELIIVNVKKFYKSLSSPHIIAEVTFMFIEYKK